MAEGSLMVSGLDLGLEDFPFSVGRLSATLGSVDQGCYKFKQKIELISPPPFIKDILNTCAILHETNLKSIYSRRNRKSKFYSRAGIEI